MRVAWGLDHFSRHLLLACFDVSSPIVCQYIIKCRSVLHSHLQHAADDVSALTGKKPEQPPRPLDDFLALAARLSRSRRKRRCLFAGSPRGFVLAVLAGCLFITIFITVVVAGRLLLLILWRILWRLVFFRHWLDRRPRRSLHEFGGILADVRRMVRPFIIIGSSGQIWRRLDRPMPPRICVRYRCAGCWCRNKESIRIVGDTRLFPRKPA